MTRRDSSETFIDSRLLWDTIGMLMDINYNLRMNCHVRGMRTARELLEVSSTWMNDWLCWMNGRYTHMR